MSPTRGMVAGRAILDMETLDREADGTISMLTGRNVG